jgi:hypothetical protein
VIVSRTHTRLSHAMRVTHACACAALDRTHAPKGTMQRVRCMCLTVPSPAEEKVDVLSFNCACNSTWCVAVAGAAQRYLDKCVFILGGDHTVVIVPMLGRRHPNSTDDDPCTLCLPHRCGSADKVDRSLSAPNLHGTVLNQRTAQQHSNQVWHHTARFTSWVYPQRVCRTCAATEHSSLLSRASARLLPSMSSLS